MGMESVQARMSHLGTSALLYGKVRESEEILAAYDQVTREELRRLAERILPLCGGLPVRRGPGASGGGVPGVAGAGEFN